MCVIVHIGTMCMPVFMHDSMLMCGSVMGMSYGMKMQMPVAFYHGIPDDKNRSDKHKGQPNKIGGIQFFPNNYKSEERTDKGGNRIKSTGFCRSKIPLGTDISKNAQPIGDKSKQQCK